VPGTNRSAVLLFGEDTPPGRNTLTPASTSRLAYHLVSPSMWGSRSVASQRRKLGEIKKPASTDDRCCRSIPCLAEPPRICEPTAEASD
jgi:hypothetical protein